MTAGLCSFCLCRGAPPQEGGGAACGHAVCRTCRKAAKCERGRCACCAFDASGPVVTVSAAPMYDAASRLLRGEEFGGRRKDNVTITPPLSRESMARLEEAARGAGLVLVREQKKSRRARLEPASRDEGFLYRWCGEEALVATSNGPHADRVLKEYPAILRLVAARARAYYDHDAVAWHDVPPQQMAWVRFSVADALAALDAEAAGARDVGEDIRLLGCGLETRVKRRRGAQLVVAKAGVAYFDNEWFGETVDDVFPAMGVGVIFAGAMLLAQGSRTSRGSSAFFEQDVILGACAFAWAMDDSAPAAVAPFLKPSLGFVKGEKLARGDPRLLKGMRAFQDLCVRHGTNPGRILDYKTDG